MKKLFILIAVSLCSLLAAAQQDVLLSQYMFNPLVINPAYAGSKDYMMATLLYRNQWVGWSGAPVTEAASLHGPLKNKNFGLGFSIVNDHIGVTTETDVYVDFSYQMQLSQGLRLGLGIQGGFSNFKYVNSDLMLDFSNPTYDRVFASPTQTNLLPNFGAGAFLYSEKFYVGLSVPHLLSYDSTKAFSINEGTLVPQEVRHYYATAGVVFDGNPDVIVKPSVLVKYVPNAPVETDFNVNVLFAHTFWLGASFRTNDAIVALVELQLSKKLRLGYAYDFTTTDIKTYSSGSHEVMLEYDFGYDIMKMKTPRYF